MAARAGTAEIDFVPQLDGLQRKLSKALAPISKRAGRDLSRGIDQGATRGVKSVDRLSKANQRLNHQLGRAAKAGLAAGAAYASVAGAKRAVDTTTELAKTTLSLHKGLGLSVKSASEFGAVLKARGADTKAVNMAFASFSKNVEAGKKGTESATDAFKALGVTQKELKTLKPEAIINQLSDGMKRLGPGTERTALSAKLFGRGWQTLGPILRGGSGALREQLALADKYGATFGGKSVKSIEDLIAAQREAKIASMGLNIAFGTQVAPALTKGINAASGFAAEMRDGTGAGGEFARSVSSVAKPIGDVVVATGKFTSKHPALLKMAGGVVAVGLALKTLRFGAALTGIDKIGGGLLRLSRTRAGQRMRESIVSGISGLAGSLKGRLAATRGTAVSTMGGVGRSAGRTMATTTSTAAGDGIVASAGRGGRLGGKFARAGRIAGRGFGIAAGAALALEIGDAIDKKLGSTGKVSGQRPTGGRRNPIGDILKLFGGRTGGVVPSYALGGTVPVRLSPGEMGIEPSGRSWMVPGRPVAADSVGALVRPRTKIITGSGQAMMAMGASVNEALARQAPHFATGGQVAGLAAKTGLRGRKLQEAVAISGAESGWNENAVNRNSNGSVDRGLWQINSIHGKLSTFDPLGNARAMSKISGRGSNWNPWVAWKSGAARGWMGRAQQAVKGITGKGGGLGKAGTLRYSVPAGTTHPLLGNILSPLVDDALLGGIEAGKEGTGRRPLLTSVLEGIAPESGDYATRKSVELGGLRGRGSKGGASPTSAKGVGSWGGRPVAKWIIPYLNFGRKHGWGGGVTSGFRTFAEQQRIWNSGIRPAARPGTSNHEGANFPRGAVDVSDASGLDRALRGYPRRKLMFAGAKDPVHFSFPHGGSYRAGGVVGFRRGGKAKKPSLGRIVKGLAGRPGNQGADRLTRRLSGRVRGRSIPVLLRARAGIQNRIRKMAANGLTGSERIQVRRLRGALALIEDELGRPIGRALGSSDAYQEITSRSLTNLDNELIVGGIDPSSEAGRQAKIGRTTSAIGSLTGRRAELGTALTRAQATGNRAAVGQVQTEINEVDDQILGLRADLVGLTNATEDATAVAEAAAERQRQLNDLLQQQLRESNLRTAVSERHFDVFRKTPPFGGSYASGGVVPGPAGAPRIIRAHGGETITPAGRSGTGDVRVVIQDERVRVWVDDVERIVDQRMRREARTGARVLPGRGGGIMR